MIDAENTGIKEWMVLIVLGGCEHYDVPVRRRRIDDILTSSNVIGRVLESGEFMKINPISLEIYRIPIWLDLV